MSLSGMAFSIKEVVGARTVAGALRPPIETVCPARPVLVSYPRMFPGRRSRLFIRAAVAAWCALAALDLVLAPERLDPASAACSLGLAVGAGLAIGAAWAIASVAVGMLPRLARWILWPAFGAGAGVLAASELGAFGKLSGPYGHLAAFVLLAAAAGGIGIGLTLSSMQHGRRAAPWAFRLPRGGQRLMASALACAAVACMYVDRTYYPDLYQEAHTALRLSTALLSMAAIALLAPTRPPRHPAARRAVSGAVLVAIVLPFALLRGNQEQVVHRISGYRFPGLALDAFRSATDADGDGYSSILAGGDCAPFNPRINPGAAEIPANGIDDNCRGGDWDPLRGAREVERNVPIPSAPSPVNVALIILDAVRSDHITPYGYARPTTPHIGAWAKDAIVFDNAFTVGGWTSIAVPAILRGRYPRRMYWTRYAETSRYRLLPFPYESKLHPRERFRTVFLLPTGDRNKPLAWWLARRGVFTSAVINDGFSSLLSKGVATGVGFTRWQEIPRGVDQKRGDAATADAAIESLETLAKNEPFFSWTHFFCAHRPYRLPPGTAFGDEVADEYDGQLVNCDAAAGRLLDALYGRRFEKPLVVIVCADHGERIHKKSSWHGDSVREDLLRIPLMIRVPGEAPRRVERPVSAIDLMPTILALTGTPAPSTLDGVDLLRVARGEDPRGGAPLLADNWWPSADGGFKVDLIAAFDGKLKLVYDRRKGGLSAVSQEPGRWDDELPDALSGDGATALRDALFRYLEETPVPGSPPPE
jgi:hypothetical protein